MKKYLIAAMAVLLVMVSCTNQMTENEVVGEYAEQTPASEVTALIEKARWGDDQAYLQLANCYRDGKGVKQDFLNMLFMMSYAEESGGIKSRKDCMSILPEESEYRLVYDALNMPNSKADETIEIADKLIARNNVEGYTIKGIILSEQNNKEEGKRLLEFAAERGSTLAQLCLCVPGCQKDSTPDIERLKVLADSVPAACKRLGDVYSGMIGDETWKDDQLAAYYYMKADEHAMLSKHSAKWLLNYHQNGGNINLSDKDIERFEKLASKKSVLQEILQCEDEDFEINEFDNDTVEIVDTITIDN